jgi:hypothetical protein
VTIDPRKKSNRTFALSRGDNPQRRKHNKPTFQLSMDRRARYGFKDGESYDRPDRQNTKELETKPSQLIAPAWKRGLIG